MTTDDFAVVRECLVNLIDFPGALAALDRIEARLNVLAGYTERIEARCKAAEDERDKARVDAERLADALREVIRKIEVYEVSGQDHETGLLPETTLAVISEFACAALAAHEEEK